MVSRKSGYASGRKFKVAINGVKQDGVYSADECGEKIAVLLHIYGSVDVKFTEVKK